MKNYWRIVKWRETPLANRAYVYTPRAINFYHKYCISSNTTVRIPSTGEEEKLGCIIGLMDPEMDTKTTSALENQRYKTR